MPIRKFQKQMFQHILNLVMKREDSELLGKAADAYIQQICDHYKGGKPEVLSSFFTIIHEGREKLLGSPSHEQIVSLLNGLAFQNVYADDVEKNTEIVQDIVRVAGELNPGEKSRKKVKQSDPSTPIP